MRLDDEAALTALTAAVEAVERRTDAELVVVLAARSSAYADVPLRAGAAAGALAMVLGVLAPITIPPGWFLVGTLGLGALAAAAARRPVILRHLVRAERKRAAVHRAAHAAFVEEAVHGTPAHTGLLLYASELEGEVELVADLGLQGLLPDGALAEARAAWRGAALPGLLLGLDRLGAVLEHHVPHRGAASDAVDLPDRPRIRR